MRKLNHLSKCYLCLLLQKLRYRGKLSVFMFVSLILHFVGNLVFGSLLHPIKWNCNIVKALASLFEKSLSYCGCRGN